VKYDITEDVWNTTRPSDSNFKPFLRIEDNVPLPQQHIWYDDFTDLVNYEICLPRDDCLQVVVAGLPTDAYKIFFGNKNVDINADFQFDDKNPVTSTEVGTCINNTPTCEDTEALVEVQYWSGEFSYRQNAFRIEDKNSNIIMNGGPTVLGMYFLNSTYACVPRDNSCYTFLIGSGYVRDPSWPLPSYSLFYDGKLVRKDDSFQFDSIQFGDACQPHCKQDNESLVEFFLYEDGSSEYEYNWDLKLVTHDASDQSTSGVVPIGPDKSPLYHKIICVPKDSCSSFYISAPTEEHMARPIYSLAMDNTTYREIEWYPGWGLSDVTPNNQTTYMGSCTVGDLCDEQSQDLFDLELHTPAEYKLRDGRSSAMIPFGNITWNFDYTNVDERVPAILRSDALLSASQYNFVGYDIDSSYRTIECVPKGGCGFSFNITADSPVETYTVKKNGVQLDDSKEVEGLIKDELHDLVLEKLSVTPFGQNCFPTNPVPPEPERRLSGGAIAGIIIACLVVLGVLIGVIMGCLNRREERQNQHDEEDPLSENLL
jgi:hypothetical protein